MQQLCDTYATRGGIRYGVLGLFAKLNLILEYFYAHIMQNVSRDYYCIRMVHSYKSENIAS